MVTVHRWDRKQGHPETAASSLKTFFTIQKKKNDAILTATVTTGHVYIFWMLFLHHGEPVELLQVVLI